jgi:hypothetical protein
MPIMQHDLFANPNARSRRAYPFVIVLQADIASEGSCSWHRWRRTMARWQVDKAACCR